MPDVGNFDGSSKHFLKGILPFQRRFLKHFPIKSTSLRHKAKKFVTHKTGMSIKKSGILN